MNAGCTVPHVSLWWRASVKVKPWDWCYIWAKAKGRSALSHFCSVFLHPFFIFCHFFQLPLFSSFDSFFFPLILLWDIPVILRRRAFTFTPGHPNAARAAIFTDLFHFYLLTPNNCMLLNEFSFLLAFTKVDHEYRFFPSPFSPLLRTQPSQDDRFYVKMTTAEKRHLRCFHFSKSTIYSKSILVLEESVKLKSHLFASLCFSLLLHLGLATFPLDISFSLFLFFWTWVRVTAWRRLDSNWSIFDS